MSASIKSFGRGRAAGLVLIALVGLGLAYLHFSGGSASVSVPSGAHAGQLTLKHCTYGNEPADCGTLVVPENRHDPHSRLIALPITRIRAHTPHPGVPIFRLQGGPGLTNMDFPDAKRFTARHDVVLVGYRGVDGSSRLDCPEVIASREHSRDLLSTASLASDASAYPCLREAAPGQGRRSRRLLAARARRRPRTRTPPARLRTNRPRQRERRHAHGDDLRLALPAEHPPLGDDRRQPARQLPLEREDDRRADPSLRRALRPGAGLPQPDARPRRIDPLGLRQDPRAASGSCRSRRATSASPASSASSTPPPPAAARSRPRRRSTRSSRSTRATGPAAPGCSPSSPELAFPRAQVWGDVASVARTDAAYGKRLFASGADRGSVIGSPGTELLWAGGRLLNAWPANPDEKEYNSVRNSNVGTLLISGQLDFATPPQNATRQLLPHLPNGHQVVLPKLGHADDFWAYQPDASTRLIDTYLDSGRIDTSLYTTNQLDFTPSTTQRAIAEIVVSVFLGFAGLAVLSAPLVRPAAPPRRDVRTEDERRRAVAAPAAARLRRLVPRRADRPGRASHRSDHRRNAGSRLDRPAGCARRLRRLVPVGGAPRRRRVGRHRHRRGRRLARLPGTRTRPASEQ